MSRNKGNIRAIILAAGTGSRLRPLTETMPKPLIRVGGSALIDRAIQGLRAVEITEIVVVGGYRAEDLSRHLQAVDRDIIFLRNPHYMKGNLLTLITALDYLEGDTLLMNADHIYPVPLLEKFVNSAEVEITLACDTDRELGQDDMKVLLDSNMRLLEIGKKLTDYNAGYMGMTFIPHSRHPDYRHAIEQTQRVYGEGAVVEQVLGMLSGSDRPPVAVDISGFGWLEIDTIEDLRRAELFIGMEDWRGFWRK